MAKNGKNATAAVYTYNGGTLNIMDDDEKNAKKGRLDKDMDEFVKNNFSDERKLNELTKTCFDILNATETPTMEKAINTLLQNDYDGVGVGQKKEVLDKQFIALQNAPMGDANQRYGYKNPTNSKYENAEKANEAYDEGVNFLTYFDVDYTDRTN